MGISQNESVAEPQDTIDDMMLEHSIENGTDAIPDMFFDFPDLETGVETIVSNSEQVGEVDQLIDTAGVSGRGQDTGNEQGNGDIGRSDGGTQGSQTVDHVVGPDVNITCGLDGGQDTGEEQGIGDIDGSGGGAQESQTSDRVGNEHVGATGGLGGGQQRGDVERVGLVE